MYSGLSGSESGLRRRDLPGWVGRGNVAFCLVRMGRDRAWSVCNFEGLSRSGHPLRDPGETSLPPACRSDQLDASHAPSSFPPPNLDSNTKPINTLPTSSTLTMGFENDTPSLEFDMFRLAALKLVLKNDEEERGVRM